MRTKSGFDEGYDTAEICPNGHCSNPFVLRSPELNKQFCELCGEKTMTACQSCKHPFHGSRQCTGNVDLLDLAGYEPPRHCHNCGAAFPWTQRKIEAAIELFLEAPQFKGDAAEQIKKDVDDLVRDTPRTLVAAGRVKKALSTIGETAASAVHDVIVGVISEAAKRVIWP